MRKKHSKITSCFRKEMFSEKVTMNGGVAKVCQDPRKMNNVFEKMPRKFSKTADV